MDIRNHDEVLNDLPLFNYKSKTTNNPLADILQCVTDPLSMGLEALYEDAQRRSYRPRIVLTESYNNKATDPDQSERYIYFDCYLRRELKNKKAIEKVEKKESKYKLLKGTSLEVGDEIEFLLYKGNKIGDTESVKNFTGRVREVYWGTLVYLKDDETMGEYTNNNCGLVLVEINEVYDRSLIINPVGIIKRNKFNLAA